MHRKNIYQSKEVSFEFEKRICLINPEIWNVTAFKLFKAAEVLYFYEKIEREISPINNNFEGKIDTLTEFFPKDFLIKGFVDLKTTRMLWGFALENHIKAVICKNELILNPEATVVPFSKTNLHDLVALIKNAQISLEANELTYLSILTKYIKWKGRYPLPIHSNDIDERFKPMPSKQKLKDRAIFVLNQIQKKKNAYTDIEYYFFDSLMQDSITEHELVFRIKEKIYKEFLK